MTGKGKDELKINVSFKQHEKEMYDFVKSQRSPSNYIKDAIEFYRQHQNYPASIVNQKAPHQEEPKATEEMDFIAANVLDF